MGDYYIRKAKAFSLLKSRIKSLLRGEISILLIDGLVDEIVENPNLAIGEKAVVEKISSIIKVYPIEQKGNELRVKHE